jgi:predicted transposase YbfD/YdcC
VRKWAAKYVREQLGIPGCQALIRQDKKVRRGGKVLFEETRYFITSLNPDEVSASEFRELIRGHWEVENCLHWQKDIHYREDKHVLRDGFGKTWTVLTNIALSLSRLLWKGERTLKEVRERFRLNPLPAAKSLGLARETC